MPDTWHCLLYRAPQPLCLGGIPLLPQLEKESPFPLSGGPKKEYLPQEQDDLKVQKTSYHERKLGP